MKKNPRPRRIYLAASLFSLRELQGNESLCRSIEDDAKGRYVMHAPQVFLKPGDCKSLRDQCLSNLLDCDVLVVQFEGTELDSGAVVEFVVAKMAGIPCVAMRTDFRRAGDQEGGDPWNLMCSFWPNTVTLQADASKWVKVNGLEAALFILGEHVVKALDQAFALPRVAGISKKRILKLANAMQKKS